ncbi:MAG: hypothetical protein Q9166_002067 [cf. Caloplaca sp. 2 TL-2023]
MSRIPTSLACLAGLSFVGVSANAISTYYVARDIEKPLFPRLETNFIDCSGLSLAVTDSKPEGDAHPREMKICPLFFTAQQTKNDLDSFKYNGNKRSWCQTEQHAEVFKMTHLDALGKIAENPARGGSHGADDVDGFGDDCVPAARDLLDA